MLRGTLMLIMGGMFAGKTKWLIKEVKTLRNFGKKEVSVIKPDADNRTPGFIESHSGERIPANEVSSTDPKSVLSFVLGCKPPHVIAIDEVHFFTDGYRMIRALLEYGYDVIAAGVALDFKGEPLGCTLQLIGLCSLDNLWILKAHCVKCGARTLLTQRLIDGQPAFYDSPQFLVGGAKPYEPRCENCIEIPGKPTFLPP